MMEMIRTKKNPDDRRARSKERVSLLGESSNNQSKNTDRLKSREGRRTKATAHPDSTEEKVSLLGSASKNKNNRPNQKRNSKYNNSKNNLPPWTRSRLMKYAALLFVSAMVTFLMLRKESKVIHWDEYHNILEPTESKTEPRCFVSMHTVVFVIKKRRNT